MDKERQKGEEEEEQTEEEESEYEEEEEMDVPERPRSAVGHAGNVTSEKGRRCAIIVMRI